MSQVWKLIKQTIDEWRQDEAPRMEPPLRIAPFSRWRRSWSS